LFVLGLILGFSCLYSFKGFSRDNGEYLLTEKRNQIVKLTPPSNHGTGGTGFQLQAPSGKVLTVTNAHICELAENNQLSAQVPDSERTVLLTILEVSESTDLCVLEGLSGASGLRLADSFQPRQRLFVLGHPRLEPLTLSEGYVTARQVIHLYDLNKTEPATCHGANRNLIMVDTLLGPTPVCMSSIDAWLTSIVIYGGNSGSPVMTVDGDVVGVIFAGSNSTNYGAFIPFDVLREFVSIY
jgi:S1-C subfamily serine protease